jgi:hypothetical protein
MEYPLWREDESVRIYLIVMYCHCLADESFDNIHKLYKWSYINMLFVQGFVKQIEIYPSDMCHNVSLVN